MRRSFEPTEIVGYIVAHPRRITTNVSPTRPPTLKAEIFPATCCSGDVRPTVSSVSPLPSSIPLHALGSRLPVQCGSRDLRRCRYGWISVLLVLRSAKAKRVKFRLSLTTVSCA